MNKGIYTISVWWGDGWDEQKRPDRWSWIEKWEGPSFLAAIYHFCRIYRLGYPGMKLQWRIKP